MLVITTGIHKIFVRTANREDPDQTASKKQSDLGLHCLSRPFLEATSIQNFRTSTLLCVYLGQHEILVLMAYMH